MLPVRLLYHYDWYLILHLGNYVSIIFTLNIHIRSLINGQRVSYQARVKEPAGNYEGRAYLLASKTHLVPVTSATLFLLLLTSVPLIRWNGNTLCRRHPWSNPRLFYGPKPLSVEQSRANQSVMAKLERASSSFCLSQSVPLLIQNKQSIT